MKSYVQSLKRIFLLPEEPQLDYTQLAGWNWITLSLTGSCRKHLQSTQGIHSNPTLLLNLTLLLHLSWLTFLKVKNSVACKRI